MIAMIQQKFSSTSLKVLGAFAVVYVVWGSTFLAIRYAIDSIPPFLMGGLRFGVAGLALFIWAWFKYDARPSWSDWRYATIVGALLLFFGNGSLIWSEQYISSGMAALICAMVPVWMVLISCIYQKQRPSFGLVAGMALGVIGVGLLTGADFQPLFSGESAGTKQAGILVLLFGTLSWAVGSLYSKYVKNELPILMTISMSMLSSAVMLFAMGGYSGEWNEFSTATLTGSSIAALVYLITFGTLLGYVAYVWLLSVSTPAKVGTYAFFNPLVAVILGWSFRGELLTQPMLVGAVAILIAVLLISISQLREDAGQEVGHIPTAKYPEFALDNTEGFIARTWHGVVANEQAEEYYKFLQSTGVPGYKAVKGNRGVFVFQRPEGENTHFFLLTLWENLEALQRYTGSDINRTRFYDTCMKLLAEPDEAPVHYELKLS
ncbi:MAG: EamA family transporter [Calditrichia bacterium]